MLAHETHIALQRVGLHGIILVKVERVDVLEAQPLFLVHANKLGVNTGGCRAGRQAEYGGLVLFLACANQSGNVVSHVPGSFLRTLENLNWNLFEGGKVVVHKLG